MNRAWISMANIYAFQELRAVNKSQKVAQQLSGLVPSFMLSCRMHWFWLNVSLEETFFAYRTDWRDLWKREYCWELNKLSFRVRKVFCVFLFSQPQAPRNSFFRSHMSPVSSVSSWNKLMLFLQWVWVVMSQCVCHRKQPEKTCLHLKPGF